MPQTAHLYSKVLPINGGRYNTGYVLYDDEGNPVSIKRQKRYKQPSHSQVRKLALREALIDTISQFNLDSLFIHTPYILRPGLEVGRIPPHIRKLTESIDITVPVQTQDEREQHKFVYGLVKQPSPKTMHTTRKTTYSGPYTIHTDGSYRPQTGEAAIGYTITEQSGKIVKIDGERTEKANGSLHSEFLAVNEALDRMSKIDPLAEINIYVDNRTVGKILKEDFEPLTRFDEIIQKIKQKYRLFENRETNIIDRSENTLADTVADISYTEDITYPQRSGYKDVISPSQKATP